MTQAGSGLILRMRGVMMDMMKEESGRTGTLSLEGELDIQRASELKTALLQAQDGMDNLVLNLDGVTGADVSGFQLLCALHRTVVKKEKQLTVIGITSLSFGQTVKNAGFEREQGCPFDQDQSCIWKAGA